MCCVQRARALIGLGQLLRASGALPRGGAPAHAGGRVRGARVRPGHARGVDGAQQPRRLLQISSGRFLDAGPLYQRALTITERRLGRRSCGRGDAVSQPRRARAFGRQLGARRTVRAAVGEDQIARPRTAASARRARFDGARRAARRTEEVRRIGASVPASDCDSRTRVRSRLARGGRRAEQSGGGSAGARPAETSRSALPPRAGQRNSRAWETTIRRPAFCANNLASLLKTRGRAKEAADLFRQALDVFTTTLGPDHPNVAICLENYADTLRKLRRWREARACAKRAARILGKVEAVNDDAVALTGTINPALRKIPARRPSSRIHRLGVFADEPIPAVAEGHRVHRGAHQPSRRQTTVGPGTQLPVSAGFVLAARRRDWRQRCGTDQPLVRAEPEDAGWCAATSCITAAGRLRPARNSRWTTSTRTNSARLRAAAGRRPAAAR